MWGVGDDPESVGKRNDSASAALAFIIVECKMGIDAGQGNKCVL